MFRRTSSTGVRYIILKHPDSQQFKVTLTLPPTAKDVMGTIKWTEQLDSIFLDNYKNDPSLLWQFFGSTTGIMRQFPASRWDADPVDLFDCRLRSWYIEAATSPKDMVVLMDISGSMKGQRKDIARHVVYNILETLGPNDFVNIYQFDEEVQAVVPCFNETLVQVCVPCVGGRIWMGGRAANTIIYPYLTRFAGYAGQQARAARELEKYRA